MFQKLESKASGSSPNTPANHSMTRPYLQEKASPTTPNIEDPLVMPYSAPSKPTTLSAVDSHSHSLPRKENREQLAGLTHRHVSLPPDGEGQTSKVMHSPGLPLEGVTQMVEDSLSQPLDGVANMDRQSPGRSSSSREGSIECSGVGVDVTVKKEL